MKRALSILALCALQACGGGGSSEGIAPVVIASPAPATQAVEVVAVAAKPEPVKMKEAEPPAGLEWTCSATLYGDSIPAGVYIDYKDEAARWERHTVAEIARLRPKWRIEPRLQPGRSLYALSWEFANDPRNTRFVIIESGVIDSWTAEPVVPRLLDMIEYVHAEGRKVILTGFARQVEKSGKFHWLTAAQIAMHETWNEGVRYAAQQTGSEFADWGAVLFIPEVDIIDAVHPDFYYHLRLTWALIDAMDRAEPRCV